MIDAMHRTTLAALCKLVTDGTHDSPKLIKKGVPFIKGKHISGGRIDFASCDYISHKDHLAVIARSKPERGDTLFSNIGSVGDAAFVDTDHEFSIKNVALFKPDHSKVDPKYLFYLLRSDGVRNEMLAAKSGSAQPFISLGALRSHQVNIHSSVETQRRIASILGAFHALIEVNRRRIAVLEEMARGLFEEWFVRFRFPGHHAVPVLDTPDGPLPEGWRYAALNEIAEVAFGFAFKSKAFSATPEGARVVRIRDVPDGMTKTWTTEPFDPRYAVVNGDILIGMDGIFHMALWVGGHAALNQRVTRLRPISGYSKGWVFLSVYPHIKFFEATISGTTVAHLGAKHLNTIRVPVADPVTQAQADKYFTPIDQQLVNLRVANQRLSASRDLLLPRLISGQLSVAEAVRQLEEAA